MHRPRGRSLACLRGIEEAAGLKHSCRKGARAAAVDPGNTGLCSEWGEGFGGLLAEE